MAKLWEPEETFAPTIWVAWCDLSNSFCMPFPHCLQHMRNEGCPFCLVPTETEEACVEEAEAVAA